MIPQFNDNGYLPPGVHPATLDEIEARFGTGSEIRHVQMESVRWMAGLATPAGVSRIVLNDIIEPNDVDCVVLIAQGFPRDRKAAEELREGLPFLQIQLVRQRAFEGLVHEFYATDRFQSPKGLVEVLA